MDRWPGDLLARLEVPSDNLWAEAVYLILLPHDEQRLVLERMDQRLRKPLEAQVAHLRELYANHFNRHLPRVASTEAWAREQHRAVEVARSGRPDEELLLLMTDWQPVEADRRAQQLIGKARDRLRKPWRAPTLR